MSPAARVCALALLVPVLALSALAVTQPVTHHGGDQAQAAAEEYAGYPMVAARLPGTAGRAPASARARAATTTADITDVGSLNWAGYAVWGKRLTFTSVRATFFVPYAQCARTKSGTLSSQWVGFDGFEGGSDSVEQAGIAADCSAAGKASYYAWYEMFPLPETRLKLAVKAGDSVTAAVTYNAVQASFKLDVIDNTRGAQTSVLHKCPDVKVGGAKLRCLRDSAEGISETPAVRSGKKLIIAALTDYGAVSFNTLFVTDAAGFGAGPVSSAWQTTKIVELRSSGGPVVALPTPTEGATFDTYWARP
jgi:Peptidase A4 family